MSITKTLYLVQFERESSPHGALQCHLVYATAKAQGLPFFGCTKFPQGFVASRGYIAGTIEVPDESNVRGKLE